jgi:signal transduction histidine kinase
MRSSAAAVGRALVARRTWAGLAYLLLAVPLDVVAAVTLLAGGLIGTALLITPLGLWVLALVLHGAALLGAYRRRTAARLLGEHVPAPPRPPGGGGVLRWRRSVLADPAGWRALAYAMAKLPMSVLSMFVGGLGFVYGLTVLTYYPLQEHRIDSWGLVVARWLTGLALLVLAPWIVHSVVTVERMLIRGLLGPSRAARRITELRETRDRAVVDADATLRRIERDLHDGAQARLIGVGMHLAMVRELVAAEAPPERVRAEVDTAQGALTEAVAELRDLVRGIHPPVLDRGLEAALATVTAGSTLPVTAEVDLPRRPPPAVESMVYFTACELLTNANRHSGAQHATIRLSADDEVLRLRVGDDGHGGARPRAGGGLAGLAERVRTVDGRLMIDSPSGGPTTVTVEIPCPGTTERR